MLESHYKLEGNFQLYLNHFLLWQQRRKLLKKQLQRKLLRKQHQKRLLRKQQKKGNKFLLKDPASVGFFFVFFIDEAPPFDYLSDNVFRLSPWSKSPRKKRISNSNIRKKTGVKLLQKNSISPSKTPQARRRKIMVHQLLPMILS